VGRPVVNNTEMVNLQKKQLALIEEQNRLLRELIDRKSPERKR
jgi:hypothetical protein